MSNHVWRQKAFTDGGTYYGITTCLNKWGCKVCNLEIELPLGMNPNEYDTTRCKEKDNVYRTDGSAMYGLQKSSGVQSLDNKLPNRQKMRELRFTGKL